MNKSLHQHPQISEDNGQILLQRTKVFPVVRLQSSNRFSHSKAARALKRTTSHTHVNQQAFKPSNFQSSSSSTLLPTTQQTHLAQGSSGDPFP